VAAAAARETWERRVREAAQGPLRFYAEIHAGTRPEYPGRIDIAVAGADREYAQRLRALAELVRDAHLRARRAPRLDVVVEPAAREAAAGGPERALHIELPPAARAEHREVYAAILADFVVQAVALPRGR
jgi:hypothetical protein